MKHDIAKDLAYPYNKEQLKQIIANDIMSAYYFDLWCDVPSFTYAGTNYRDAYDIKDGQTVKGTNFVNLRQAGDPVELGHTYSEQGADELVFLDITASHEGRKTFTDLVKRVAANINIPFTVGGGINELNDVDRLLNAGADKVSINSSAIRNPDLVDKIAKHFGSQVCVVAIDAKQTETGWKCYLNGGRIETDKYLFDWAKEGFRLSGSSSTNRTYWLMIEKAVCSAS